MQKHFLNCYPLSATALTENSLMDLYSLGLLKVSGIDAKKLLQGQLTCHLDEVTPSQIRLGAQCNPQGRVISFFRLFQENEQYYLLMPREMVPLTLNALKKYAVFFKVGLQDESDQWICNGYKEMDFNAGIPAIYPETSGQLLPHEINLPALNAVSFQKGCYTGQEIIARMQYRGKVKTRLYHGTAPSGLLLQRGQDIYDNTGSPAGMLIDFYIKNENTVRVQVVANKIQGLFLDKNRSYPIN